MAAALKVFELLSASTALRDKLEQNTQYFREQMTAAGFKIRPGVHPIMPIMLGDEQRTVRMAREMNERGIFVVGFSYPVVPKGEARIRVQVSAAHTREQLRQAIETFTEVGKNLAVI